MSGPSEMNDLLEQVRGADDPSQEDEERVLQKVRASLPLLFAEVPMGEDIDGSHAPSGRGTDVSGKTLGSKLAGASLSAKVGLVVGAIAVAGAGALITAPDSASLTHAPSGPGRVHEQVPDEEPPQTPPSSSPDDSAPRQLTQESPPEQRTAPPEPPEISPENPPFSKGSTAPHRPSTAKRSAELRASKGKPSPTPEPSRSPPQSSVSEELEAIKLAQAALARGQARAALRALDAVKTSAHLLRQEREALRILALCQLGRSEEASQLARTFKRSFPESVHWGSISRSCTNL